MLTGYDKTLPVAGPSGVGASAYQTWLALPGNAGRTPADFVASLGQAGAVSPTDLANGLAGKLDATVIALLAVLDALPTLPTNPALYPAGGGLFRDGDANGYRLVRLFPAS